MGWTAAPRIARGEGHHLHTGANAHRDRHMDARTDLSLLVHSWARSARRGRHAQDQIGPVVLSQWFGSTGARVNLSWLGLGKLLAAGWGGMGGSIGWPTTDSPRPQWRPPHGCRRCRRLGCDAVGECLRASTLEKQGGDGPQHQKQDRGGALGALCGGASEQ